MTRSIIAASVPLLLVLVALPGAAYENEFGTSHTMLGPGTASCDDLHETKVGSDFSGTGIAPGTYGLHRITLTNTERVELRAELTFQSVAQSQMALYLFPPGADTQNCEEAIATAGPGPSPVSLSAGHLPGAGGYHLRVELDGLAVDGYKVHVWTVEP